MVEDQENFEVSNKASIERWRSVIEATSDYVVVVDNDLKISYVNRTKSGTRKKDLIGKFLPNYYHETARDRVEQTLRGVLQTGQNAAYYTENEDLDNQTVYFESNASVFTIDGTVEGIIVVSRDISDRRRTEAALIRSEHYNRSLFEQSSIGLVVCQMDGKLVDINNAFAQITGRTIEECKELTYWDLTPEKYAASESLQLEEMSKTGHYGPYEKEYIHKDGHLVPVRLNGSLLLEDDKLFIWSSVEDITKRVRTQEALRKSQKMLKLVLDAIPVRVFWKDRDGLYLGCNRHFANDGGLDSPEDIVGKNDYELGWQEQAERSRADDLSVMNNDAAKIGYEERQTTTDSGHRWLQTSKIPLREDDGEVFGILGVYEDITERKRARDDLRESEHRQSEAQRIAKFGHWELNHTSSELKWSDEIYRIFEIERQEFGASYDAFLNAIHPDDRGLVEATFDASVKNKKPYTIEHRLLLSENRIKHVHERGDTIYSDDGNPIRSVGTVQDITERVDMEDALRRSQKMDAIGQLSGGIAHDFNNQLAVIIGYLEMLEEDIPSNETAREWVNFASKAASHCTDLTRRLLTFSRRQSTEKTTVNLGLAVKELHPIIARSVTPEVEVRYEYDGKTWSVAVDFGELQDAIVNLVLNARDAMPTGGKLLIQTSNTELVADRGAIKLQLEPGDYVQLTLTDTGTGMDKHTMEHLFEPFFTTKPEGEGTGLGLAMVYAFLKRSGGNIEVDSAVGEGTTFRLYFPRSNTSKFALIRDVDDLADSDLPTGNESILIVDDEVALLKLTQKQISKLGYQTRVAENAARALDILAEDMEIDLLISDIVMPGGMNGFELADQATKQRPNLKVLLTSGFASESVDKGDLARFSAYFLNKPFRLSALAHKIRLALDDDATSPSREDTKPTR